MLKYSITIIAIFFFGIGLQSCSKHSFAHKEAKPIYYTCPMHNDIIEMKPSYCPKCEMALEIFDIDERILRNSESLPSHTGTGSNSGGHSGGCH